MTATRDDVTANVVEVRRGIARACERAGRDVDEVRLVAASKTVPPEAIRWALDAGVTDFGENYVKELRDKHAAAPDARWHFIGTLQTNTAHHVAAAGRCGRDARRWSRDGAAGPQSRGSGRTIDALIEVDLTGERTGVAPDEVAATADAISTLEGLRLVGLMTIPPLTEHPEDARPFFAQLRRAPRSDP